MTGPSYGVASLPKTIAVTVALLALAAGGVVAVQVARRGESTPHDAAPPEDPEQARAAGEPPSWFGQSEVAGKPIAGHVTLAGKPVAAALVTLHDILTDARARPALERRTATDGSFDFGVQPAASYDVTAGVDDKTSAIEHVELANPQPSEHLELRLADCTASVTGSIVDASERPIPHARVRRDRLVGVNADDRGAYRICVPPGDVALEYSAEGHGGVALIVDARGHARRDIVLAPEATLDVRALRADGRPIADAYLDVRSLDRGAEHPAAARALTDKDGKAHVVGLVPGAYDVRAFAGRSKTAKLAVTIGASPEVVLRLEPTARIHGKVVERGSAVAGVEVRAGDASAYSQRDGSFWLEQVSLGDVELAALPYRVVSPATLHVGEAKDHEIVLDVARLGSITGRITRNGAAVAGAKVCCVRDARTTSGPDGRYEFRGVAAGTYDLSAATSEAFVNSEKVTLAGAEDQTVDLELDLGATITGTVVDQDGKPVPGVFVRWNYLETEDVGQCTTDDRGRYRCSAMTGGGHYQSSVSPSAANLEPFPTPGDAPYPRLELVDNTSVRDNVRIAIVYQHLAIRGRVVDDAGKPVANARVRALPAQEGKPPVFHAWSHLPTTSTDRNGAFVLGDLVTGSYALQARTPSGDGIAPRVAAGAANVTVQIRPATPP